MTRDKRATSSYQDTHTSALPVYQCVQNVPVNVNTMRMFNATLKNIEVTHLSFILFKELAVYRGQRKGEKEKEMIIFSVGCQDTVFCPSNQPPSMKR